MEYLEVSVRQTSRLDDIAKNDLIIVSAKVIECSVADKEFVKDRIVESLQKRTGIEAYRRNNGTLDVFVWRWYMPPWRAAKIVQSIIKDWADVMPEES